MTIICRHIAVFLLLSLSISSAAETTLIHAGQLLAIPGESPTSRQTIVVENNQIREIVDGFADATDFDGNVSVIDLSDHFVLPGLMDMHVHLQFELGPQNERDALKMSDQLKQMRSIHYAMETLLAGFTTVRDVGSSPQEMYAMRDAIEKGWIDGPRIIAAGGVGITGGHADISGVNPGLMELFTSPNVCDGPYDCRRAARNVIKYGADWIKITSTGGVMTDRDTGTDQQMALPVLNTAPTPARAQSNYSKKPVLTWYRPCSPERRSWPWLSNQTL
jgi:imidazolonepropionase-like amidohydrolase